ncbi:hypothetical protein RQP46_010393 [Phenoliferia psychrophenolica]
MTSIFRDNLFHGKVAFVTGGGSGICYAMTEALMAHGANATILGRREDVITASAASLSLKTGRQCLGISGDVRSPESLKAAVEATVAKFGRIDFVICGAAGNFLSPIEGMSENAFQTVMSIDTLGTYNTIKATVEEVKKAQGSFIATSATLHYKGTFLQAHVSAAKAAIDALFRVAAVEYGPFGVRFNVIAPGPIGETEGVARLLPAETRAAVIRAIPMQRLGVLADIANAGVYLFSDAASYITGTVLVVDGGEFHTSGVSVQQFYPDMVLDGGDFRKQLASKL